MSIYATNPLVSSRTHIRLLKISPGSRSDAIRCVFNIFDLATTPDYEALSYEWGPESPTERILVNDQPITIRHNLWTFLSRLRAHGYHGHLWCDAICIDQSNDEERSHQVQMMTQIYGEAKRVLIWLGKEREDSTLVFQTLRCISAAKDERSRAALLTERERIVEGLRCVSKRTYWSRIWIVQEITLARDLSVFCGEEAIPWQIFASACQYPPDLYTLWACELWKHPDRDDLTKQTVRRGVGRELNHSTMYTLIRSQRRWPFSMDSFEDLYERYKESGCQDGRDRIFALLGLAREVTLQRRFIPDYRKTREDTFISLIQWAGAGSIKRNSRLRFAQMSAKAMGLEWSQYPLEWTLSEPQRPSHYVRWASWPLTISLPCRDLGRCSFDCSGDGKVWTADVGIGSVFPGKVSVQLYLPKDGLGTILPITFRIFCFETSNVLLAGIDTGPGTWTVVNRAFYLFPDKRRDPHDAFVRSIFEGLEVIVEGDGHCKIEVRNFAQFMEIFLDEIDPSLLKDKSDRSGGGGGSQQQQPPRKLEKPQDNNLIAHFQRKMATMTWNGNENVREEISNTEDSVARDLDNLHSEGVTLANRRTLKTSVEEPKHHRRRHLINYEEHTALIDSASDGIVAHELPGTEYQSQLTKDITKEDLRNASRWAPKISKPLTLEYFN
ncbi:HET-domain-containing protein [Thozetella sp. PMI_491]|nr:HET-domain-containing protein [Thozetella sp. PMI_491]